MICITTSFYNLISLQELHNNENTIIISRDILNIEISDKILDSLVSQELYAGRYVILKNPETFAHLMRKNDEILQLIDNLKEVIKAPAKIIKEVVKTKGSDNDFMA